MIYDAKVLNPFASSEEDGEVEIPEELPEEETETTSFEDDGIGDVADDDLAEEGEGEEIKEDEEDDSEIEE